MYENKIIKRQTLVLEIQLYLNRKSQAKRGK